MTARCDIRRSGPGGSVCGGERRACCGAPSCRQGQGKGTDNGNKGTDNGNKGTDNRSKAKVLRHADEAKACCCCAQLRRD
jgi:hypothetical protein